MKMVLVNNVNRPHVFNTFAVEPKETVVVDYTLIKGDRKIKNCIRSKEICMFVVTAPKVSGIINKCRLITTALINPGRKLKNAPVEETPVEEKPVEETPVEEKPVEETPVEEKPVEEKPVEETPVEETPVEETPVEETPEPVKVEEIKDKPKRVRNRSKAVPAAQPVKQEEVKDKPKRVRIRTKAKPASEASELL